MKFLLPGGIPPKRSIPALAGSEIDAARALLAAPEVAPEAIHEARKHFKRVRALLELARAAGGDGEIKQLRRTVADAGRELAAMRDARVVGAAAKAMQKVCTSPKQAPAFADLVCWLRARSDRLEESAGVTSAKAALQHLDSAKSELGLIALDKVDRRALLKAANRTYKRGRRAMAVALKSSKDEALHEWRKQVQHHWRQTDLLREAWGKPAKKRIALARDLSDSLGEHHDLSLLKGTIIANGAVFERPGELETLCQAIDKKKRALAASAARMGRKLYAERTLGPQAKMRRRWRKAAKRQGEVRAFLAAAAA